LRAQAWSVPNKREVALRFVQQAVGALEAEGGRPKLRAEGNAALADMYFSQQVRGPPAHPVGGV